MYYALKNKIKKVLQFVAFCRIRRKVSFSSKGSPCFHRNTKVTLVAGAKKEQMVEAVQEMKQDILGLDDLTDLDDMDIEFDEGW